LEQRITLATPAALGHGDRVFSVLSAYHEGPAGDFPDWVSFEMRITDSGAVFDGTHAFAEVGDLWGIASWMDALATRASTDALVSPARNERPVLSFQEPVEFDALSWGADRARVRVLWHSDPPWPQHEDSIGPWSITVDTDVAQLRAFADAMRELSGALPARGGGGGCSPPLWLFVAALVLLLGSSIVGAVQIIRWLLAL